MTQPRHDRIFHLKDLNYYPGSEFLDMTFFLPQAEDARRRVWALFPESAPTITIDDVTLNPQNVPTEQPHWLDYGTADLPLGFSQLRVYGMGVSECASSYLLITSRLDFAPESWHIHDVERALWGIARGDVGSTTLRPSRVTVGSPASFVVRYANGPRELPAGALIRFAAPKAFARPQADEPDSPGYVSIVSADCEVSVSAVDFPSIESHEASDIICRLGTALPPFGAVEVSYKTDWTYIWPSLFHENDRRYWHSKLPPMSAAVALAEDAPFVSVREERTHIAEIVPGPAERLHLFLPGRRHSSEQLTLRGTFTDRYRNSPPSGAIDSDLELWLIADDERIPLGTPAGHFIARHRFEIPLPALRPGVYRAIACRLGIENEIARSNPLEVIDEEGDRVFWGEIHGHSEMSDGSGDYSELYRHAKDEGCLDFAAAADHACYFSDNEWLWMQDVTNSWNTPDRFVTLIGYEWAGKQSHRNLYTSRDRLKLFRGMYPPTSNINVPWEHFHGDDEVVGGPHAPLMHGLVWEHHDPSVERFVEIYSMWGASDRRDNPLIPVWNRGKDRGMTVNEVFATGAKLGFTGGGDCHEGRVGFTVEDPDGQGATPHTFAAVLHFRCGMTAAVMPRLDRPDLIRALRNRRTYATTGARILLDFTVAGHPMGAAGKASQVECRVSVHACDDIQSVEIVRDGEVVSSHEPGSMDASIVWQDPVPTTEEHYYYVRVIQTDGQMAWASPVWVQPPDKA